MEKIRVSAIILNYNSSSDCRKCVSYLKRQKDVDLEIVLIDNDSPDKQEVEALCREYGCTFIQAKDNKGYNAGNNIGLRYAVSKGYEYALIANPDMEFPQTDYVKKLCEAIRCDEEVVVCGSNIVGLDGLPQNPLLRDGNWKSYLDWIVNLKKENKSDTPNYIDNYTTNHYCVKVSGCCLMVRLSFMESIGFFDEYPFLYCEEAILSRQIELSGKKMYYLADVQAIHAHIKSTKGKTSIRLGHWKRSRFYFIKKYSGDTKLGKIFSCTFIRIYMIVIWVLDHLRKWKN